MLVPARSCRIQPTHLLKAWQESSCKQPSLPLWCRPSTIGSLHGSSSRGRRQMDSQVMEEKGTMTREEATDLLFETLRMGDTKMAKAAIEAGGDVQSQSTKRYTDAARTAERYTPLHLAAFTGNVDVARLLIEKGADLNARDFMKETPLHVAAQYGQMDVARLLIEKAAALGINEFLNAQDERDASPLHWAAARGHPDIAALLIGQGADVNSKAARRNTPLHWASYHGTTDLARMLI